MLQQQQCLEPQQQQQQQHRNSTTVATKTAASNNNENTIFRRALRKHCRENVVVGARITARQHVAASFTKARKLQTATATTTRTTTATKNKTISKKLRICVQQYVAREKHLAVTLAATTTATNATATTTSPIKLLNAADHSSGSSSRSSAQVFLNANSPKQQRKNASNMLPQHFVRQSSSTSSSSTSSSAIKNAANNKNNDNNKENAKTINRTASAASSNGLIVAAMLPATLLPPLGAAAAAAGTAATHTNNSDEKTIDFNSRRRRGRLRPDWQAAAVAAAESRCYAPATLAAVLATYAKNVAYRLPVLLTSLLLSFIVAYVNITKKLVLSITGAEEAASAATATSAAATPEAASAPASASASVAAALAAAARTKITVKCCPPRPMLSTFYALLLCTSMMLPGGINFAAAAKPKSATQLKQQLQQHQEQQQQQQQQLHNQHQHPKPVAAGADSVVFDNGVLRTPPSYQVVSSNEQSEFLYPSSQSGEQMYVEEETEQWPSASDNMDNEEHANYEQPKLSNETMYGNETFVEEVKKALFPSDLFNKYQLEHGAVVFHIVGVIYMFVALAIVCDEFFVPSLDVIIEKLGITDDVAGATFMAAGGSAPELFTSVIGVFVSFDDVGIGTIVGSAVFNILFVIGMCALFSKTVLTLTWWPLFRDCTFYSISLIVLIAFFRDNLIYWWEALILFSIYVAYVGFMKWNVQVERCVKKMFTQNKVTRVRSTDQLMPAGNAAHNSSETSMATQQGGSMTSRAASERAGPTGAGGSAGATGNNGGGTATGAKFRHGLLQLMIHTIDPLHDDDVPGKVDEKATQLHAIASLKVLLDATKPQRGGATTSAANHVKINLKETTLADRPNGNIDTTLNSPSLSGQRRPSWIEQRVKIQTRKFSIKAPEIPDVPEPLSMAWPSTWRKRVTYVLVAPLLIPMWLTLPDTRTPRGKQFYPVTFIGSIVWIAAFSYLMVWWANVAGDTAQIPPEVMGLTFLAAGTSIPDLITSVIVARKGYGDMAVSSSVGSNIFDVTVGLPIPWLLFGIIYGAPVEVNSVGMVCSITILFMMLLFVVMSIACFHWKMNKGLGFTMFLLYFAFVAVSLMFEYDVINCPV